MLYPTLESYLQGSYSEQELIELTQSMLKAQGIPCLSKEDNASPKYHIQNLRSPVGSLITTDRYSYRLEGINPGNLISCLDAYMRANTDLERNNITNKCYFLDELESAHIKASLKWKEAKFDNAVYRTEIDENYAVLKESFQNIAQFDYKEYQKAYPEMKLKFKKSFQAEKDFQNEKEKKPFAKPEEKPSLFTLEPILK